ncbi:hypothetical protein ES702_00393 [subsurface metagenome]
MSEERLEEVEKRLDRIEKKMRKHASKRDERKIQCANRLNRIEKKLQKRIKERKMDLKEKFRLHDRAQSLLRQSDERKGEWLGMYPAVSPFPSPRNKVDAFYKDLQEIIKELAKLVDVALGVKFPS